MKTGKLRRIMGLVLTLAMLLTMVALPTGALAARSYAATPTDDNSGAQNRNIERVIDSINGYTLVNGAQFSFNHAVGERSKERGYENATNGRGVKTYGGGSGQVAATIDLAVKDMKGIRIDQLSTYGERDDRQLCRDRRRRGCGRLEVGHGLRLHQQDWQHHHDVPVAG